MRSTYSCWLADRIDKSKIHRHSPMEGGHQQCIEHDNVYEVANLYASRVSKAINLRNGELVLVGDPTGYIHKLQVVKSDNNISVEFIH